MSDFFNKTDLSRNDAEKIISETLNNCDDGELYLENSKSESIVLDDGKIKSSAYSSDLGYGLRAVTGEVVAYSHSNEISKNSLKQSAENLTSTLKSKKGIYNHEISKTNEKLYHDFGIPYKYNILFHGVPGTGKTSLIFSLASELKMNIAIMTFTKDMDDNMLGPFR